MAHKAVEMKRSERSDAEIQLSKQVVQTFPSFVQLGCKCVPVEDRWRGTLFATTDVRDAYRSSFSPRGGEKVTEKPAPYLIRGRMRGEHKA